ncbi:hypothetical protein [Streptomyces zhihengii]
MNGPEHYTEGERHLSAASYLDKPGGKPADPTTATYHLMAAQAHFAAAQVAVDAARLAGKYVGDGAHINEWLGAVGWLPLASHTEDQPISLPAAQKDLAVHTTAEAWVNLGHAMLAQGQTDSADVGALRAALVAWRTAVSHAIAWNLSFAETDEQHKPWLELALSLQRDGLDVTADVDAITPGFGKDPAGVWKPPTVQREDHLRWCAEMPVPWADPAWGPEKP